MKVHFSLDESGSKVDSIFDEKVENSEKIDIADPEKIEIANIIPISTSGRLPSDI